MTKGSFKAVQSKETVTLEIGKSYVIDGKYIPLPCIYSAVKAAVNNDMTKIQRFRNTVAAGKYNVTSVPQDGGTYSVRAIDVEHPMNTGNASIILEIKIVEG